MDSKKRRALEHLFPNEFNKVAPGPPRLHRNAESNSAYAKCYSTGIPPRNIPPLRIPSTPGVTGAYAEQNGGDPITLGDPTGAGEAQVLGVRTENAARDKMDSTMKPGAAQEVGDGMSNPSHIGEFIEREDDGFTSLGDIVSHLTSQMEGFSESGAIDRFADYIEAQGDSASEELSDLMNKTSKKICLALKKKFPKERRDMHVYASDLITRASFLTAYGKR